VSVSKTLYFCVGCKGEWDFCERGVFFALGQRRSRQLLGPQDRAEAIEILFWSWKKGVRRVQHGLREATKFVGYRGKPFVSCDGSGALLCLCATGKQAGATVA
jgi:hypothetical protein